MLVAALVLLAVTATEPGLAAVPRGAVHAGEPWNVAVHEVLVGAQQENLEPTVEGDRFLAVRATVEITADETRSDVEDAVRLADVAGLREEEPVQVLLRRDGGPANGLHPGLPEEIELWWEQDGSQPPPTAVAVEIIGKTFRLNLIAGNEDWTDPQPRAVVRLDAQPAPPPTPAPTPTPTP